MSSTHSSPTVSPSDSGSDKQWHEDTTKCVVCFDESHDSSDCPLPAECYYAMLVMTGYNCGSSGGFKKSEWPIGAIMKIPRVIAGPAYEKLRDMLNRNLDPNEFRLAIGWLMFESCCPKCGATGHSNARKSDVCDAVPFLRRAEDTRPRDEFEKHNRAFIQLLDALMISPEAMAMRTEIMMSTPFCFEDSNTGKQLMNLGEYPIIQKCLMSPSSPSGLQRFSKRTAKYLTAPFAPIKDVTEEATSTRQQDTSTRKSPRLARRKLEQEQVGRVGPSGLSPTRGLSKYIPSYLDQQCWDLTTNSPPDLSSSTRPANQVISIDSQADRKVNLAKLKTESSQNFGEKIPIPSRCAISSVSRIFCSSASNPPQPQKTRRATLCSTSIRNTATHKEEHNRKMLRATRRHSQTFQVNKFVTSPTVPITSTNVDAYSSRLPTSSEVEPYEKDPKLDNNRMKKPKITGESSHNVAVEKFLSPPASQIIDTYPRESGSPRPSCTSGTRLAEIPHSREKPERKFLVANTRKYLKNSSQKFVSPPAAEIISPIVGSSGSQYNKIGLDKQSEKATTSRTISSILPSKKRTRDDDGDSCGHKHRRIL